MGKYRQTETSHVTKKGVRAAAELHFLLTDRRRQLCNNRTYRASIYMSVDSWGESNDPVVQCASVLNHVPRVTALASIYRFKGHAVETGVSIPPRRPT